MWHWTLQSMSLRGCPNKYQRFMWCIHRCWLYWKAVIRLTPSAWTLSPLRITKTVIKKSHFFQYYYVQSIWLFSNGKWLFFGESKHQRILIYSLVEWRLLNENHSKLSGFSDRNKKIKIIHFWQPSTSWTAMQCIDVIQINRTRIYRHIRITNI